MTRAGGRGLFLLLTAAMPAVALDLAAYARLLERHVRPGAIDGIRLAVVDYAALRDDPDYPSEFLANPTKGVERLEPQRRPAGRLAMTGVTAEA